MKFTKYSLFLCVIALAGCAYLMDYGNGQSYRVFYEPAEGMTSEKITELRAAPPAKSPIVERAQQGEYDAAVDAVKKRGFVEIGHSFFSSPHKNDISEAEAWARAKKADLVLFLEPRYKETGTYQHCENYDACPAKGKTCTRTECHDVTADFYYFGAVFFVKQRN